MDIAGMGRNKWILVMWEDDYDWGRWLASWELLGADGVKVTGHRLQSDRHPSTEISCQHLETQLHYHSPYPYPY